MRLISNVPIRKLHELNLSRDCFGTAKCFIAEGEKLKISEQKLCFLRRCKRQQVFPAFILNNLPLKDSLFPVNQTTSTQHHLNRLRTISLNQNISHQYQLISDRVTVNVIYHSLKTDCIIQSTMIFSCVFVRFRRAINTTSRRSTRRGCRRNLSGCCPNTIRYQHRHHLSLSSQLMKGLPPSTAIPSRTPRNLFWL